MNEIGSPSLRARGGVLGYVPDPGFPLNCPKCGQKLAYVRSEGNLHFYRCPRAMGPLSCRRPASCGWTIPRILARGGWTGRAGSSGRTSSRVRWARCLGCSICAARSLTAKVARACSHSPSVCRISYASECVYSKSPRKDHRRVRGLRENAHANGADMSEAELRDHAEDILTAMRPRYGDPRPRGTVP